MSSDKRIEYIILPNKIRMVLDPVHHTETCTVGLQVGAGSFTEGPSTLGYSHFIEHMVFKGTENRDYIQINKDIEKFGGYLNAFTDKHYTSFYVKSLSEYIFQCMDVLTDIVFRPTFPVEELAKEKNVVFEEILMYEDSPDEWINDLFFEFLFKNSPLGWSLLGKAETINAITREALLKYYNNNYHSENIIVSVCGKYDRGRIIEYFSRIPHKEGKVNKNRETPLFSHGIGARDKKVEQAYLAFGLEAFSLYDSRKYLISILNNMFGANSSSRLYINIREKLGLCYSIQSSIYLDEKTGLFGVFAASKPENTAQLIDAITNELSRLKTDKISQEELEISKAQFKSALVFNQESLSYRMQKNANDIYWHNEVVPFSEIQIQIEKTTVKDLHDLAEELFGRNPDVSMFSILPKAYLKKLPKKIALNGDINAE